MWKYISSCMSVKYVDFVTDVVIDSDVNYPSSYSYARSTILSDHQQSQSHLHLH